MSDQPKCACLRIQYDPEDVEFENPVTKKMIMGKKDRWLCQDCGSEFNRTLWHIGRFLQQQDEIDVLRHKLVAKKVIQERLQARVDALTKEVGFQRAAKDEYRKKNEHLRGALEEMPCDCSLPQFKCSRCIALAEQK